MAALLAAALSSLAGAAPAATAPAAPAGKQPAKPIELKDYGIETTIPELILLERLNAAVRYQPAQLIEYDWRGSYDRVTVVELLGVENRYALFENDKQKRADIAIRGTVNFKNAVFDFEFMKRRSDTLGIFLHSGFEKVAFALYADLKPRLKPGYAIRVAGHSLGAAEACIVGMLLQKDGFKVEKVLASAPPKVTDAEGWSAFASLPVIRLVCPYDPVPFLPPRGPVYGKNPYIHGGKVLLLLDGTAFTVLEASFFDELPEVLKQVYADKRHFDVADHLQPAYFDRLLPKAGGLEYVDPASWDSYAKPAGK